MAHRLRLPRDLERWGWPGIRPEMHMAGARGQRLAQPPQPPQPRGTAVCLRGAESGSLQDGEVVGTLETQTGSSSGNGRLTPLRPPGSRGKSSRPS